MRRRLVPALCVLALCAATSACATSAPPPPDTELTWVKPRVPFEAFAADVDACNAHAHAAGRAVQEHRGDPMNAFPLIMVWRWLEDGFAVNRAMTQAYDACFRPRGYTLAYVSDADAQAFRALIAAPMDPATPMAARGERLREAQLRLLHAIATAPNARRARLEPRQQRRPLVALLAKTSM